MEGEYVRAKRERTHCGEWLDAGMRGLGDDWSAILLSTEVRLWGITHLM
jgi:hypothetical protein